MEGVVDKRFFTEHMCTSGGDNQASICFVPLQWNIGIDPASWNDCQLQIVFKDIFRTKILDTVGFNLNRSHRSVLLSKSYIALLVRRSLLGLQNRMRSDILSLEPYALVLALS